MGAQAGDGGGDIKLLSQEYQDYKDGRAITPSFELVIARYPLAGHN